MNIKEIEQRSGLPRSGVRFYESEGLLSPARSPNGYRDYSEGDLDTLLKIKRLRALGLSLAEIKDIQRGNLPLADALRALMGRLHELRGGLEGAEAECRSLIESGAGWDDMMTVSLPAPEDSLPAPPEERRQYFDSGIKYGTGGPSRSVAPPWWHSSQTPGHWRRFFARLLDDMLYGCLIAAFNMLVLRINPAREEALDGLVSWLLRCLLLFACEPLCLHLFGATPGKWLLGISVRTWENGRLSLGEAFARTSKVFTLGMGAQIPLLTTIMYFLAWRRSLRGEDQPWDADFGRWLLVCRPRGSALTAIGVAAYAGATLLVSLLAVDFATMPPHRGDISLDEFVVNYNEMADYFGIGQYEEMTSQGLADATPPGIYVVGLSQGGSDPEFAFTETYGVLTRVEFSAHETSFADTAWVSSYTHYMELCVMSYIWGRPGAGALQAAERDGMLSFLSAHDFESFDVTWAGVRVSCQVEYSGYYDPGSTGLLRIEGVDPSFSLRFVMERA